jgi:mannose-1-phosphate guanylyltransferase
MKAILLAAGFGTRLRPLTDTIPKCLVPVKNRCLLQIWLEQLTEQGIGPFLVNTHYLHQKVEDFTNTSRFKDAVELVYEPILLGTAGTLIKNSAFFEGKDGMLIHADNYCMPDWRAFMQAHRDRPGGCVMTMMTFRTDTPSSCGIVELDSKGVVVGFHEKVANPPGNLANGAVYILSSNFIADIRENLSHAAEFSTEVLSRYIGKIYSYETNEVFMDIGTPEAYARANSC